MGSLAWTLLMGWLMQAVAATVGCAWYRHLLDRPQPLPAATPPVLVLVPVRGPAPDLGAFLAGLLAQDYPAWRAVLAIEHPDDPAHAVLASAVAAAPERLALVVAGTAAGRGQKVHNLLAALAALRADDAALVTLDADIHPPPGLLRELLRPVLAGQGAIATGYRWSVPADARLGSSLLAAIDVGIATLPRHARLNLCWGGATAIGRAALDRLNLSRVWDGALSDDLTLTRAARAAGLVIYAPLMVRPLSPTRANLADAWRFGVRQYRLLRLHAPWMWVLAGALILLPPAGFFAAIALGPRITAVAFGTALTLAAIRVWLRAEIAPRVLPPDATRTHYAIPLAPLASLLHAAVWIASAVGNAITWGGRRYRLRGASVV